MIKKPLFHVILDDLSLNNQFRLLRLFTPPLSLAILTFLVNSWLLSSVSNFRSNALFSSTRLSNRYWQVQVIRFDGTSWRTDFCSNFEKFKRTTYLTVLTDLMDRIWRLLSIYQTAVSLAPPPLKNFSDNLRWLLMMPWLSFFASSILVNSKWPKRWAHTHADTALRASRQKKAAKLISLWSVRWSKKSSCISYQIRFWCGKYLSD